jgi:FMN phosphatase YigB (HAD superfamily)
MYSKLALFDIDGTLIAHAGALTPALTRYQIALKATYGIIIYNLTKYNGFIERAIAWDLLKDSGISRDEFWKIYVRGPCASLVELATLNSVRAYSG